MLVAPDSLIPQANKSLYATESAQKPNETRSVVIPTLQPRKLRLIRIKYFTQDRSANLFVEKLDYYLRSVCEREKKRGL